jgi:outer membrane protein TolC
LNVFNQGKTDSTTYNFGLREVLPTGGALEVDFTNGRSETNNTFATFNPSYSSGLQASFSQPLLRNLRIDATRQAIRVAKKNREISDAQFHQVVLNTSATVRRLYYDLLYAIDNLGAQRKSLDLAKKLLDENQIKVRVGTLAPLDVVSAEAEVASRDEQVIVAEAAVDNAMDAVRQAIFPRNAPETWATEIVPTDHPTAEPVHVDVEAATLRALQERTDVVAARKALESAQISADYGRSQALPGADLVASYGTKGAGGTALTRDGLGGPIIATDPGGYSDALSQALGRDFPNWSVGVNLSYPILNRSASARSARLKVARDQSEARLRALELDVAGQVRAAARAVETNYKRVESTRAARVLQERTVDAETKRFGAGMSTNFIVTRAQRDLALAEVAELLAIADYRKSLVGFELVQAAGGSVTFR